MNQFIMSQWFEYKDDLKSNFEDCISEAEHTKKLFRSIEYPRVFIPEICVEVLNHLLKLVINRGKNSLKLRLVDSIDENIPSSCSCDTMFWLRDKKGYYWIIDTFYGTFESLVSLDRVGMTKDLWVTLLMHLSLGFIQRLRRCDELNNNSLVVLRHRSYNCCIRQLFDLKGLCNRRGFSRLYLSYALEDMPHKSLDPLFSLMSDEQKAEIEKILDTVKEKDENLSEELAMLHHPESKLALVGIGTEQARLLVEKIAEFGLKGYVAICFRQYYPPPFGYYHEHFNEKMHEMMEEYANKFNGDTYFIAVGYTLNTLLKDIEKRTLEFEASDMVA